MDVTIPKRIMQTSKNIDLSVSAKASAVSVRLLNPDFEYLFFTDEQIEIFMNDEYPEYINVFRAFPFPIQRIDFFRYLAIYHYGGFYFDTDVYLASSLSDLLDFGCVFPFEALTINGYLREAYGIDWEIGNYAFGAAPKHPFLQAIIENCVRAQNDRVWLQEILRSIPRMFREEYCVLYSTGPGLVTRTLAEYPNAAKEVKVLFPEDVCDSKYWNLFGNYGIHAIEGSWRSRKGMLRRRLIAAWRSWERKKVFREAKRLGKTRSLDFKKKQRAF